MDLPRDGAPAPVRRLVDVVHPVFVCGAHERWRVGEAVDGAAPVFRPCEPVGAGVVLDIVGAVAVVEEVPLAVFDAEVAAGVSQQGRATVEVVPLAEFEEWRAGLSKVVAVIGEGQAELVVDVVFVRFRSRGTAGVEEEVAAVVPGDGRGHDVVAVEGAGGAEGEDWVVGGLVPGRRKTCGTSCPVQQQAGGATRDILQEPASGCARHAWFAPMRVTRSCGRGGCAAWRSRTGVVFWTQSGDRLLCCSVHVPVIGLVARVIQQLLEHVSRSFKIRRGPFLLARVLQCRSQREAD